MFDNIETVYIADSYRSKDLCILVSAICIAYIVYTLLMIAEKTRKIKLLNKEKNLIEKGNLKREQMRYFGQATTENQANISNEYNIPSAEDRQFLFSKR